MLSNIKVLVWDFDGTLYKPTQQSHDDTRNAEFQVIADRMGWKREKAKEEFYQVYKVKTVSGTQAVALICRISTVDAATCCEHYMDRSKYLKRDEKLIAMFQRLHQFRHYLLVNGLQKTTKDALSILGVPIETFVEIVTSEIVGDNKPSLKGYQYILDKTKDLPEAHLMIGDRVDIDLTPAKHLGMKTCLVWSDKQDPVVDVALPTVYEILSLFSYK